MADAEEEPVHVALGDLPSGEKEELIVSLASMVIHDSEKEFTVRCLAFYLSIIGSNSLFAPSSPG
jgi:hypothetical protein